MVLEIKSSKCIGIVAANHTGYVEAMFHCMEVSREAQLFVGWVSDSVTHAGVGFHASTQPTSILYLIPPTYLA